MKPKLMKRKFIEQKLMMQGFFIKKMGMLIAAVMAMVFLCEGCMVQKLDTKEKKKIDYTVVKNADIPEEFAKEIEKTQDVDFKLTYDDNEYLYIAKGYGAQNTGGYSISVTNLYASSNSIYFETDLIGPKKGENVNSQASYPYIVVKIEHTEQPVVFK